MYLFFSKLVSQFDVLSGGELHWKYLFDDGVSKEYHILMWFVLVCERYYMMSYDALEEGQLIGPFETKEKARNAKKEIDAIESDCIDDRLFITFIFQQKPWSELKVDGL